jgi:predicted nucleotidyltransferase
MARPRPKKIDSAVRSYVERATQACGADLVLIMLYGSQARGDASAESDIDLITVISRESPNLQRALEELAWQVQFEHNVVISDIIRTSDDWERMRSESFPFFQSIIREGVVLWNSTSAPTPEHGSGGIANGARQHRGRPSAGHITRSSTWHRQPCSVRLLSAASIPAWSLPFPSI